MSSDDEMFEAKDAEDDLELLEDEKLAMEAMHGLDLDDESKGPQVAFAEHKSAVFTVAIHPLDENLFASGGEDDLAYVWSSKDGASLSTLTGHTDSVISVQFSSDGKLLASAGMDGTVRIWDTTSTEPRHVLDGPGAELEWIRWHQAGEVIAGGSADGTAWLWNAASGKCMQVFSGHAGSVRCGQFDRQTGKVLVTGGEEGSVFVWKPKTGTAKCCLKGDEFHQGPISVLDSSPVAPLVVSGSEDGKVFVSHIGTGKVIQEVFSSEAAIESVAFSASFMAVGDLGGEIGIIDASSWKPRIKLSHDDGVVRLKWHPIEESILFSASLDRTVRAWDVRSGEAVRIWKGHEAPILDLCVSATGRTIASCGDDCMVLVYEFL